MQLACYHLFAAFSDSKIRQALKIFFQSSAVFINSHIRSAGPALLSPCLAHRRFHSIKPHY